MQRQICLKIFLLLLIGFQGRLICGADLVGFSQEGSNKETEIEKIFLSVPSPDSSRRHHLILTEEPHVAGTAQQRKVAEYLLNVMQKEGIDSKLVEYRVYLPYPKKVSLSLIEPDQQELSLKEKGYPVDKDSYSEDVILPFNAYSPSGQIEAQVIYVNYGLPEDFDALESMGVDVKGKIVLARYGESFRGVKVKVAEEHGASGILIYSDPYDDGYFKGDIYPEGPMRPPSGIQRGSIQYLFAYPGDPLTPQRPALKDAERLNPAEAKNIPRIPSQPISYETASILLSSLAGKNVPEGWQGALPFAYHVGPGPARVRLDVEMDYAIRPVWDVVGRIEGKAYPDEWVIIGNHTDAWTYGGVDPSSGTTSMIEVIRGFGELLRQGYKPSRTVIFAGWDGEEYGLLGSTEWGEQYQQELQSKAVAYLNVDSSVSGPNFSADAVPSLSDLIKQVARDVPDPNGGNVYDSWAKNEDQEDSAGPRVGYLGSGSDYTVFLDYLGVPSLNMSFRGSYGVYHSIYDGHYWMTHFGDPAWQYHPTMAKIWGLLALRLANSEVLPFNFGAYGHAITEFLGELQKEAEKSSITSIQWEPLKQQASQIEKTGNQIFEKIRQTKGNSIPDARAGRVNELLRSVEGKFLISSGLPNRNWFRHSIFAPGYRTGYASKALPGIAEAIESGEPLIASAQADLLLDRLKEVNSILDQVRRLLL